MLTRWLLIGLLISVVVLLLVAGAVVQYVRRQSALAPAEKPGSEPASVDALNLEKPGDKPPDPESIHPAAMDPDADDRRADTLRRRDR